MEYLKKNAKFLRAAHKTWFTDRIYAILTLWVRKFW